ncbi:MAG: DUF481 domain-containing protein [Holophagaceae bacterium]|nr:DUF481 domain-containing protein [Holophagaceae bacterium]
MKKVCVLLTSCFVFGQEPPPRTWTNVTSLSLVATTGNTSGNTIGFSDKYTKKWSLMTLTINGGMIRSETTFIRHSGKGTSLDNATVYEERSSSVTAENYTMSARFDYRLKDKDRWYWYGGTSWEQNLPIGLESRTAISAGMGRILADTKSKWRIDVGLGATREQPTYPPAGYQNEFGTFNLTSSYQRTFHGNINYNTDLECTYNLKKIEDSLYIFKQGIAVTMTKGTSLKIGLNMNYRNIPGLISVAAYTPDTPPEHLGNLIISAKKLDTTATTSLVISF